VGVAVESKRQRERKRERGGDEVKVTGGVRGRRSAR
jgi:hypothetical protein